MTNEYNKPIIKWIGGKTQIIEKVINKIPTKIADYHELFLGGGSVMIALLIDIENKKKTITGKIYGYDINETLINMYKNIQKNPDEVLIEIKKIINEYNSDIEKSEKYYKIRAIYNKLPQEEKNKIIGSAYFIFLNKTCFRGMYREGPNGFNVPYGNYKNPEIINEKHLKHISKLIKDVEFQCESFEKVFPKIKNNSFIYLDPPYAPEKESSFVNYTKDGFTLQQHKLLFNLCNEYKNINFLMSNADVDIVNEHFKNYKIEKIICKRAINSKKPNATAGEVLITN